MRHETRASLRIGLLVAALVECAAASASPSPSEKATAEALFEQGRALLEAGRTREACDKFAASEELDSGIGTLLFLGDCFERLGKTASAWAMFKQAWSSAQAAGQLERARIAEVRAQALSARLSKVVIDVPADVAEASPEIIRDGARIPRAAWGEETPVDPGEHRVEVRLANGRSWVAVLEIPVGSSTTRLVAKLPSPLVGVEQLKAYEPSEAESLRRLQAPEKVPVADAHAQAETDSTQRTLGWITAGTGLVGMGVGSYFGVRAITDKSASDDVCRTETLCTQEGIELRERAARNGTISTVAFGVGGALVVSGLVLVWTAPGGKPDKPNASVSLIAAPTINSARIGLEGAW